MPTDPTTQPPPPSSPPQSPRGPRHSRRAALAAALLAVGAGGTALIQRSHRPVLVALAPTPIATLQNGKLAAVKGEVAEIFGNKFILTDGSGRTLIETGREGEGGNIVAKSETVTVQGRFESGFMRAAAIQHGDGRVLVLGPAAGGPPPPPPHPPLG